MNTTTGNQDDSGVFSDHAMINNTSTKVLAIVNVPGNFAVSGFIFIKIESGVYCAKDMYYDASTGLFYDDAEFTMINGVPVNQSDSAGQAESTS